MPRVRFSHEYEQYGAGLLADVDEETAKAAIADGAAEEMTRVKMAADFGHGGQVFAAQQEYDLTAEQLKAARAAGAVPEEGAEGAHRPARGRHRKAESKAEG
jgi:hypothetical protein